MSDSAFSTSETADHRAYAKVFFGRQSELVVRFQLVNQASRAKKVLAERFIACDKN